MDPVSDLSDKFSFLAEMETEFKALKNENDKLEAILYYKEKELNKAKGMISGMEIEIERIFEYGIGILSNKEKELNDAKETITKLKKEMNAMIEFGFGFMSNKEKEMDNAKKSIAYLKQKIITIIDISEDSISEKKIEEKQISHENGGNGSLSNDQEQTDGHSDKQGKNHKDRVKYLEALTDINESLAQLLLDNNMDKDDSIKILSLAHDRKANLKTEKQIIDSIELINRKSICISENESSVRHRTIGNKKTT